MSALGWQDALVAALAVLALGWLVRRRLRRRRGPTAVCDECPGCATGKSTQAPAAPAARANGRLIPFSELLRHDR
jgi:hypothetical protein